MLIISYKYARFILCAFLGRMVLQYAEILFFSYNALVMFAL